MTPTTYSSATLPITLPTPTWTGYDFGGWFDSVNLTGTAVTTIPVGSTGDKEFWAKWTAIPKYTVMFDAQGGSEVASQL
jgi:uncharacterized repeat protein (TIGR02543 family)